MLLSGDTELLVRLGRLFADDDRRLSRERAQGRVAFRRSPRGNALRAWGHAGGIGDFTHPLGIGDRDGESGVIIFERDVERTGLIVSFAEHRVIADGVDPKISADFEGAAQFVLVETDGARVVSGLDHPLSEIITLGRDRANFVAF